MSLLPRDATRGSLGVVELRKERATISFPVNQMAAIIYGSKQEVDRKAYLDRLLEQDPELDPTQLPFLAHHERYSESLKTYKRLLYLKEKHQLSFQDFDYMIYATGDWHSLALQEVYLGALSNLASDEQLKKYYEPSRNFRMIGCYAQTELAHGSNVRGIMTTATYLPEEDAFDIHTPVLEATKFWAGSMGKSSTHAIVFARLILPEGDLGVHSFMVQIRCLKTHKSLPGRTMGDIGPKFGFLGVDNGFLQFNHVKIPRTDMLSRFGKVLPGGKYERPVSSKLGYAGMTATRVSLAVRSGTALAKAVTIAVRYSIVRRQGGEGRKENQIIDYTIQQQRLFSQLANAYALHFSGSYLIELIESFRQGVAKGNVDLELLNELHVVSSGLKSTCSTIAAEGMEDCRKCCGGHGYSQFSGIPDLYASFVHICTAEGDNHILTQQTTRYLLRCHNESRQGSFKASSPFTKYLEKTAAQVDQERCPATAANHFLDPKVQIAAFEHRAARSVMNVAERIEAAVARGLDPEAAWNSVLVEVYRCSFAHCLLLILISFTKVVEKNAAIPSVHRVLKSLCDLFALFHIEKDLSEFLEDGYLSRKQVSAMKDQARYLLTEIRPDAVGLVDAWSFPDFTLNSAIGRFDGNVYDALFAWAQKEPLNRQDVAPGVDAHLRPIIDGTLSKL